MGEWVLLLLLLALVEVVVVVGSETTVWIWGNRCTFAGTRTRTHAGTRRIGVALAAWMGRLLVQRLSGPVAVLVDSEGHRSRYIGGTLAMQIAEAERGLVELELVAGLPHQWEGRGQRRASRAASASLEWQRKSNSHSQTHHHGSK